MMSSPRCSCSRRVIRSNRSSAESVAAIVCGRMRRRRRRSHAKDRRAKSGNRARQGPGIMLLLLIALIIAYHL
jgi:hypothetical protein